MSWTLSLQTVVAVVTLVVLWTGLCVVLMHCCHLGIYLLYFTHLLLKWLSN